MNLDKQKDSVCSNRLQDFASYFGKNFIFQNFYMVVNIIINIKLVELDK